MSERFGAATKQKSNWIVMDDKVVVDAFDFICITHETEWSQCKAKRRYPNDYSTDNKSNQMK